MTTEVRYAPPPVTQTSPAAPRASRVLMVLLGLFGAAVSSTSIDPNDTWWHIKSGEYYLQHHTVPSTDVFSHTAAGRTYFPHEWLSQVILHLVYRGFGFVGIRVLNSVMAAVALVLLYRLYRRATPRTLPLLFGLVLIFPDFLGRLNTRPEIFTLPLTVAFVDLILHRDRSAPLRLPRVLGVGLVAALWANLHGMALLGLLFYVAWIAGQATTLLVRRVVRVPEWDAVTRSGLRSDLVLAGVFALAVLLSPMGYRIYVHAWEGRRFLPGPLGIMEWLSPFQFLSGILHSFLTQQFPWINVSLGWQFLFLAIPIACCFAFPVLAARRALPTLGAIFMVLLAIYEAAAAVRFRWLFFIPIFWLLRALDGEPAPARAGAPRSTLTALVLHPFLLLVVASGLYMMVTRGITFRRTIDTRNYPVGIANFLGDLGVGGNLFNTYNWGGYLIFRLSPSYRVFIDGRTDLYALADRNLMLDHVTIDTKQPGYQELLDSYQVDILVASHRIYFPGPELAGEGRFEAEQRREQLIRSAGGREREAAPAAADWLTDTGAGPDTSLWSLLLVNHEGSVYLRNTAANTARRRAVAAFFAQRGIPYSPATGPDLAELIRRQPRHAARYGVVPDELMRGLVRTADRPASEEAIRLQIQLAGNLIDLELFRDGIAILEEVLRHDHYNNDALMRIALAYHLVGDNRRALLSLDRSATIGRNPAAAVWLGHCQSHELPVSERRAKLPSLPVLIREWASLRS